MSNLKYHAPGVPPLCVTAAVAAAFHGDVDATQVAVLDAIDTGTPPHIAPIDEVGRLTMLRRPAAIRPLEPLLVGHRIPLRTDGLLAVAAALPFNVSTTVLIVNADRSRAAGLDPARPPGTWAAMAADRLDAARTRCVPATGRPVWIQLENVPSWHDLPLATRVTATMVRGPGRCSTRGGWSSTWSRGGRGSAPAGSVPIRWRGAGASPRAGAPC